MTLCKHCPIVYPLYTRLLPPIEYFRSEILYNIANSCTLCNGPIGKYFMLHNHHYSYNQTKFTCFIISMLYLQVDNTCKKYSITFKEKKNNQSLGLL